MYRLILKKNVWEIWLRCMKNPAPTITTVFIFSSSTKQLHVKAAQKHRQLNVHLTSPKQISEKFSDVDL